MTKKIQMFVVAVLFCFNFGNNAFATVGINPMIHTNAAYDDCYVVIIMQGQASSQSFTIEGTPVQISVYSPTGDLVYEDNHPNDASKIDLSSHKVGTYSVEVLTTVGIEYFRFTNE